MKTLSRRTLAAVSILSILCVIPAGAATLTWTGEGADDLWSTPANWGGTAPTAGDSLIFTSTRRLSNTNNLPSGILFNGITFDLPAGAFNLRGNPITLGGDIADNQVVTLQTISLSLALNTTPNVAVVSDASLTLGGVISGAGHGITKSGGGLLTLGAANTFGGPLTVNAGTVSVSSDSNLGAVPASPTAGKIILSDGTLRATSSFAINANRGMTLTGVGTFEVGSGINLTNGGTAAGTGGLTKLRFGGLTLSGANTYTGPTAISNGAVTLDFTQAASPANNVINPASTLTFGGATAGQGTVNNSSLFMTPKANTANSQSFDDTHIYFGAANIQLNSNNLSTANLALGEITHSDGGFVTFVPPTLRGGQGKITTTSQNVNGILGGWATVGDGTISTGWLRSTNWASVDATGSIVNYSNHTVYSSGLVKDILSGSVNLVIPDSITTDLDVDVDGAASVTDVNTIIFDRNAAWTFRIGSGNTLRLGKSGALFNRLTVAGPTWVVGSGTAGGAGTQATAGMLTAGGPTPDSPGELILINTTTGSGSGNNWNIDAQIVDNGAGKVTLVKSGSGFCKLRHQNTYSGGTYFLGGRIQLAGNETGAANPGGIGTGPLHIFPGSYLYVNFGGTVINTLTNDAFIAGTGTPQETGLGGMRLGNNVVYAGSITLIGDARLCGQNNNNGGNFTGPISGPFSLTLANRSSINGNVTLSNPGNSWNGNTILQARDNTGNNNVINGASDVIPNGFGKGNVIMDGLTTGTITWNLNSFSETINGLSTIGTGPSSIILNGVAATTSILTVGDNDQSGTFGGQINNGAGTVALTKTGGGILTLTGANAYSGVTTVSNGTLALAGAGSIANSTTILVDNATLDVAEAINGFTHAFPVTVVNGALSVRTSVSNHIAALNLTDSSVRVASVGSGPVAIDTSMLTTGGTSNLIDVVSVGNVTGYPATFTIIKYSGFIDGAGFNFALGNVPTPSTVGYITNNEANTSIDLVLLDGPKALHWTAAMGTAWDINNSINWRAFGLTPSVFLDVDLVRFDDNALAHNVNLTTAVRPSATVVSNEIATYTFAGSGKLSGPTGLTKEGAGTLILDNTGTNDFFGPMAITTGTVQIGNNSAGGSLGAGLVANNATLAFARSDNAVFDTSISGSGTLRQDGPGILTLSGNSTFTGPTVVAQSTLKAGSGTAFGTADNSTTVNSGATLDVNGQNLSAEPVVVSGTGVGGNGAIVNTGAEQLNALRIVTLAGDVALGGSARWDIRGTGAELRSAASPFKIIKVGTNQVSLVGVMVDAALGEVEIQQGNFSVQTTTTQVGDPGAALLVHGGATLGLFGLNAVPLHKAITLRDQARVWSENGSNIINGQIVLEGITIFDVTNAGTTPTLIVNAELGGSGGLVKIGPGRMVMNGPFNSYAGATVVSNGTLLVDGIYSEFATFNVQGGTLGGVGTITGPLVVHAGGTLAPGNVATPIGTLTLGGAVTLSGTSSMDVVKSGGGIANDFLTTLDTLTLGGTLSLNLTGEALADGDAIVLFGFNSASGSFTSIVPATPGPGLMWGTSDLASSGTLRVLAIPQLEFRSVSQSGTNLVMTGRNGPSGAMFRVLTSTDLETPTPNWVPVTTNMFDLNGNFNVTQGIDPGTLKRFFLIQVQQ
jgi:fibronectin-binding autotransporter adhesin